MCTHLITELQNNEVKSDRTERRIRQIDNCSWLFQQLFGNKKTQWRSLKIQTHEQIESDTQRTFWSTTAKYTFLSRTHIILSKNDYILDLKMPINYKGLKQHKLCFLVTMD